MSERYLYSVHPKKPIKDLPNIAIIRTPKSLALTLEDVLICLKNAVVYRRFANEKRNERVTISNAERLHNAKFMTEEEYKEFLLAKSGDTGNVFVPPVEEEASVEETPVVAAPVVEDTLVENTTVEETAKVEETVEESPVVEEDSNASVEEEASVEETPVVAAPVVEEKKEQQRVSVDDAKLDTVSIKNEKPHYNNNHKNKR